MAYLFRTILIVLFGFIIFKLSSCSAQKTQVSNQKYSLIEEAVNKTNNLLVNVDKTITWIKGNEGIEIDTIESLMAPIAYVPKGSERIIFNPEKIEAFSTTYLKESSQSMKVDPINALSIILLHEVSHILLGHSVDSDNGYHENSQLEYDRYNLESNEYKRREYQADSLAANIISKSIENGSLDASEISLAVSFLSWNIQGDRIINNWGAQKSVFWDKSKTHPNFELRILYMNYFITHIEDAKYLIDEFIKSRQNIQSDTLWRQ